SPTGQMVVQAINGTLVRNDDDTVRETGEIAYVDLDTYALSNGPCRGCAYHARDQVLTSDVTHLAWVAPRTIEFTVNGMTETAVGLLNGPPLLAQSSLTGTWLRMRYSDSVGFDTLLDDPNFPPDHIESVDVVLIEPVDEAIDFTFAEGDPPPHVVVPPDPSVLPPAGAELYEVTCLNPDCRLNRPDHLSYGAGSQYIWMGAGNQGR